MDNEISTVSPEEMDKRKKICIESARKILKLIGENDNVLGDISIEDRKIYYAQVSDKIIDMFKEVGVAMEDTDFIFTLLFQAYESIRTAVNNSNGRLNDMVMEKFFGKDKYDITIQDFYDKLKS